MSSHFTSSSRQLMPQSRKFNVKKIWEIALLASVNKLHKRNIIRYFVLSYNFIIERNPSNDPKNSAIVSLFMIQFSNISFSLEEISSDLFKIMKCPPFFIMNAFFIDLTGKSLSLSP